MTVKRDKRQFKIIFGLGRIPWKRKQVLIVLAASLLIEFPNAVIVNIYIKVIKIKIIYLPYNCDFPLDCVVADGQQNEWIKRHMNSKSTVNL